MRLFLFILCIAAQDGGFDDFENDEIDAGNGQCIGDDCGEFINDDNFDNFEDPDITVEDADEDAEFDTDEFVDDRVNVGNEMMDVEPGEFEDDEEFISETFKTFKTQIPKADLDVIEIPDALRPKKPAYYIEYGMGVILFLYVLNYIYGRVTNGNIAQDWFDKSQQYLETQFALIGDAGEKEIVSTLAMTREADHIFTLWCSGRLNMTGMLATLKMVKRQDVFNQVHSKYVVPTIDQMIIRFTLDKMDPICMSIGRSTALKDILDNYTDIHYFCSDKIRSGERYGLSRLSYVTESSDALLLFDKKLQTILQGAVGDALISLHISDQFQGARVPEGEEQDPPSQSVIFVFEMTDIEKCATQFLKFCIFFVDHVSRHSLSREALEKHKKRRQKREDERNRLKHAERQEELAKKKEDERREEYQRMQDEQDPEKQKRMEIDINNRAKKQNQRKSMKMKQMKIRT